MTEKLFDPKKPCVRRYGAKIAQLVELVQPLWAGQTLYAVDEFGFGSSHFQNGRYLIGIENENDLVNVPEKATVQAWAVVKRCDGKVDWLCEIEPYDLAPHLIVVPLTGEYER